MPPIGLPPEVVMNRRALPLTVAVVLLGVLVFAAPPELGGPLPPPFPLFPPDNWWNTDISGAPVDPGSAAFINFIGGDVLHPDFGGEVCPGCVGIYGLPYIVVDAAQPKRTVTFLYDDESDHIGYPIPDEAITQPHWVEHGEPGNQYVPDVDRHILIVDKDNKYLYELYNAWWDGAKWTADSGAFFDMKTNNRRPEGWTSADAAGLAIVPGLVRYEEVYGSAEIGHAFRFTVRLSNGYVYPASHQAGDYPGALPMGARLRLKANKDISRFPAEVQRIFRAMKKHGLIVADNGADMFIQGTFDTRWNNDILNPAFGGLTANDFEVIQLGWKPPTSSSSLSVAAPSPVTEGNSGTTNATFTVTLSPASTSTVTVDYATANGTATAGSDYVAKSGTLTFAAGETTKTVAVTVNGDTADEPDETFHLSLSNPTNATLGTSQATATILDDDVPTVSMSINDVAHTEGNSGTTSAVLTVSLSAAAAQIVTVDYATANGTATAGSDYAAASGNLSFSVGQTSRTIAVAVTGDTAVEPDETFFVNLSGAAGATLADGQGRVTITNDDTAPLPTLVINDVTVAEGNSGTTSARFTVTLSASSTSTVTVAYATANGTATAGSDYVAKSGTLTFAPGATQQFVDVTVNGDTAVEPNETFLVNLSSPSSATVVDAQGQGTITNDDTAPLPSLAINDVTVPEGNSGATNARFTVTLSAASTSTVTVAYATADGSAAAGSDYAAKSGTLTFAAGTTQQFVEVAVNGDTAVEPNETFLVNLSGPSGATIADGQGQGTITNDDTGPLPALSVDDPAVMEGSRGMTSLRFTVLLSAPTVAAVTVAYATADGTASAGTDYLAASGTLTFAAGTTRQIVDVAVGGDTVAEPNETLFLNLTGASGAVVADGQGQGTILNDDATKLPPGRTVPVAWTSLVGVKARDNSLRKVAADGWGNAGAVSTQQIASGEGYVELTASETTTKRMVGLSNGNTNSSYDDIDFGLYADAGGVLAVWEAGTFRGEFGTYATGDKLRVAVGGGVVSYAKNGVVFYRSTKAPTYPLLVDSALLTKRATLLSAVVSGFSPGPQPVVWTAAVGVTASGNSLSKTAASGWGNAGAISKQQIGTGEGYVEFTASETTTKRMVGLSNGNASSSYDDIDFGLYVDAGAALAVWEAGTFKGTFGAYASGDKLRVAVAGGVVRYYRNGAVFYTSTKTPVYPLLVDTALLTTGATITDVVIGGAPLLQSRSRR
jgi:hypothetical protein